MIPRLRMEAVHQGGSPDLGIYLVRANVEDLSTVSADQLMNTFNIVENWLKEHQFRQVGPDWFCVEMSVPQYTAFILRFG